jgi:hypothetical protein
VQLHQRLHQHEPDADAALGAVQRRAHLREHAEQAGQMLAGDPDAVVTHRDREPVPLALRGEQDAAAGIGVLRGVGQQIADDLRQSRGVRVQPHRGLGQAHRQLVPSVVEQGARRLERALHHRSELRPLEPELQLPARDPRPACISRWVLPTNSVAGRPVSCSTWRFTKR